MKEVIKRYCINCLWHFTDESNIESIKQHGGLFSLKELETRKIKVPSPGGNEWSHDADNYMGVDVYVHLCFRNTHPMLFRAEEDGRIKNPIWLRIDNSILLNNDVRFTADVSNKSGVPILNHESAKKNIDFDVLYKYMNWRDSDIQQRRQSAEKSEVLVPETVPLNKIINI